MIVAGHSFTAIQDYTLPQIKLFYQESAKRSAKEFAKSIQIVRIGAWAEEKEYKKIVDELLGSS